MPCFSEKCSNYSVFYQNINFTPSQQLGSVFQKSANYSEPFLTERGAFFHIWGKILFFRKVLIFFCLTAKCYAILFFSILFFRKKCLFCQILGSDLRCRAKFCFTDTSWHDRTNRKCSEEWRFVNLSVFQNLHNHFSCFSIRIDRSVQLWRLFARNKVLVLRKKPSEFKKRALLSKNTEKIIGKTFRICSETTPFQPENNRTFLRSWWEISENSNGKYNSAKKHWKKVP